MRPIFLLSQVLLIAIVLLSSLGCSGAGSGVTPTEDLTPLQRWVATRADGMGMNAGFTLTIDTQTGIARLYHDGVMTQEIVITSAGEDGTVTTTATAPAE